MLYVQCMAEVVEMEGSGGGTDLHEEKWEGLRMRLLRLLLCVQWLR